MAEPPDEVAAGHRRVTEAYRRRQAQDQVPPHPSLAFIIAERVRLTRALLQESGFGSLATCRILDLGCGDGYWIRKLVDWGANAGRITGIELLGDRIRSAAGAGPAAVQWVRGSGSDLPFERETFDLVLQSTVFSSVLEREIRDRIAREMERVLRPGGAVLWYDFTFDNPRNPDVLGMPREEIRRLFPGWEMQLRRVTLAPPLARRIPASLLPVLYPVLSGLVLLRTHFVGVLRRPGWQAGGATDWRRGEAD